MKIFKQLAGCMGLVFILCAISMAAVNYQDYLNADGTVNQDAINAAIAAGADPIKLAVDLAKANPELADEFSVAIVKAEPAIDVVKLATEVIAAVPNQAQDVSDALMAKFPGSATAIAAAVNGIPGVPQDQKNGIQQAAIQITTGNAFQATNNNTNNNQDLNNQNTESEQYQQQQSDQGKTPSPNS